MRVMWWHIKLDIDTVPLRFIHASFVTYVGKAVDLNDEQSLICSKVLIVISINHEKPSCGINFCCEFLQYERTSWKSYS